jgi:hypothetical protein
MVVLDLMMLWLAMLVETVFTVPSCDESDILDS